MGVSKSIRFIYLSPPPGSPSLIPQHWSLVAELANLIIPDGVVVLHEVSPPSSRLHEYALSNLKLRGLLLSLCFYYSFVGWVLIKHALDLGEVTLSQLVAFSIYQS